MEGLPTYLQHKWRRHAARMRENTSTPGLADLVVFNSLDAREVAKSVYDNLGAVKSPKSCPKGVQEGSTVPQQQQAIKLRRLSARPAAQRTATLCSDVKRSRQCNPRRGLKWPRIVGYATVTSKQVTRLEDADLRVHVLPQGADSSISNSFTSRMRTSEEPPASVSTCGKRRLLSRVAP